MKRTWAALAGVVLLAVLAVTALREPARPPSWSLVFARPTQNKYEDLQFPSADKGWLIAASGDIFHTPDGGRTWSPQASGLGHLRSMEMLDTRRGFAGTLSGQLYATQDGATWSDITPSLPVAPGGFCGMHHLGDTVHLVGRFVGGVTDHFVSTDAGASWTHHDLREVAQGLVDVLLLSPEVVLIGGMDHAEVPSSGPPLILRSTDGGATWSRVFSLPGGRGFAWKLFAVGPNLVFAALQTEDGVLRVARSDDAGATWRVQVVASGRREDPGVQAVGFVSEREGWVGGFFAGMYHTKDGGESWVYEPSPDRAINRFTLAEGVLFTASRRGVLRYGGR